MSDKPKVKAIVTIRIGDRIVEADCSLSDDTVIARPGLEPDEDQESALRETIERHVKNRHSLGLSKTMIPAKIRSHERAIVIDLPKTAN